MSDVNRNVLFSSFCSPLCQGTPHPFVLLLFLIEVVSYKKKKKICFHVMLTKHIHLNLCKISYSYELHAVSCILILNRIPANHS